MEHGHVPQGPSSNSCWQDACFVDIPIFNDSSLWEKGNHDNAIFDHFSGRGGEVELESYSVAQAALELSASLLSVGIIGMGHHAQLVTTILRKSSPSSCQGLWFTPATSALGRS